MNQNQPFKCLNCGKEVKSAQNVGTKHRNHCPFCLFSKHVDLKVSGDRRSNCWGLMEPVALTFKQEGDDKYKTKKQGELMLVHKCTKDNKISINRIAADDNPQEILKVFETSLISDMKDFLDEDIKILKEEDRKQLNKQLFGDTNL